MKITTLWGTETVELKNIKEKIKAPLSHAVYFELVQKSLEQF